jgi:hypothetical protein
MSRTLQFKRYGSATLANTIGANGELIINTTNKTLTVHDGITPGGFTLLNEAVEMDIDQYARNTANSATSNITIIQGVNVTQNTNITSVNNFAQNAFNKANAAYNYANTIISDTQIDQYARNTANTNLNNITIVQGVNADQNTRISIAEGVDVGQNTRITIIENVNTTQNTNISSADTKAQAAFDSANTKLSLSGGIIAGNVTSNYFIGNGSQLSGISYDNISNTPPMVSPQYEYHVAKNGNDTTGDGSLLNPWLTIGKALTASANSSKIILHAGSYDEEVNVNNLLSTTFTSFDAGGFGSASPSINGNVIVSGTSSSIAFKNVGIRRGLTHSASGSLYLTDLTVGSSDYLATFNKSGSGYLSVQDCSIANIVGANLPNVNITGSGVSLFNNTQFASLTANNASAQISLVNGCTTYSVTLLTGTLNVFDCIMYTLSPSANAIAATGGTLQLRNSLLVNPTNMTPAKINLASPTVFAYDDIFFDRTNSVLGISANTVADFQNVRLFNSLSANTISANTITNNQLIFPDNTYQNTAFTDTQVTNITSATNLAQAAFNQANTGVQTYTNSNVISLLSSFGSNNITTTGNVTASRFIGDGSALSNVTANIANIAGNIVGTQPNVTLVAGSYDWTFDNTGTLTLPGNTFDVKYNNGTQVDIVTRFEGSWNVATGNSTVSFTVNENETYYMWVEGNIPNGIITWNATATITNTNVPVVGAQYAWVYSGGGTPIDFTSLPNQFIGTANTIVRSSVAPSATTNRFDFGINNTSGSAQTVRYGWVKIS